MSYQQAYHKTPVNVIEVKHLSRAVVMSAKEPTGTYFGKEKGTAPFMKLFRFIQANNIPMTTPVEVDVEQNEMLFYAPPSATDISYKNTPDVVTKTIPERTVVSIGMRGRYSQKNFETGKVRLLNWLDAHDTEWKTVDKPYAVYWDAPYTLPFLKHSEVHIMVEPAGR